MTDTAELSQRYASALQGYLGGADESALQEAYEVGREVLEAGLGPLVLFSIHRDVVRRLPAEPIQPSDFIAQVTTVFIEALAPFQMAYASFDEARAAVEELQAMIESHRGVVERIAARLHSVHETAATRRRLIADIVTAGEEERRRMAGEIHDDAVQNMTVVLLRLGMLRRELADSGHADVIEQLEESVRHSIERLRGMIAGLAPPELERGGLGPAVRATLDQLEQEFGLRTRLDDRLEAEPDLQVGSIAFRIVHEALANARKHAQASAIEVTLQTVDGGVSARVADDGAGFDAEDAFEQAERGHLGLGTMRERAELMGGWLKVDSGHDGTTIEFWLPGAGEPPQPPPRAER
jgi:signal transduction histidine kinase